MSKIITVYESADSTEECVDLINNHYKESQWKRKAKFNIPKSAYLKSTVRVFSDGSEYVSIVLDEDSTSICPELDFRIIRPLIDEITKHAKNFYTHDYGEIFLNPYELSLWVVGGDGGYGYSSKSKKEIRKHIQANNYDFFDSENNDFHDLIPAISSTQWEAEYFPNDQDEGFGDWLQVGQISDIGEMISYE